MWLECSGVALGAGRVALLEAIERDGSITKAARSLSVSYRAAWKWIDRMNHMGEGPVVEASSGGALGGGAILTPFGRALIDAYHLVERRTGDELVRANRAIKRLLETRQRER